MNQNNGQNNGGKNNKNNNKRTLNIITIVLWALVVTIVLNFILSSVNSGKSSLDPYSDFRRWVVNDQVYEVVMENSLYTVTLKADMEAAVAQQEALDQALSGWSFLMAGRRGSATVVTHAVVPVDDPELIPLLDEHGVKYSVKQVGASDYFLSFLVSYILPMVLMVGLLVFFFRFMSKKMGGGGGIGGIGGVGKANAKVYVEKKTGVTFADVAGQDEAKESLEEIIDFLHNPGKYTEIGAKLPKGALLVGSPGTGKTLLAKAVAGEAGVPFFSISGSDFVELYVGVGASRVRDLFKEASKMAPCIVFIDEIDTIGRARNDRFGGGDSEREQTLNQLLSEMDGFDPTKGVILLAATNRPEVLDKALLRPGRFDRRITVDRPNLAGRLATLQVHTRNIRLAEDVDLNKIAQATAGAVGADLANLVNEAALRAVRFGRRAVNQQDLLASFEQVIAGSEKKGTVLTEKEKKLIAYHEVGHALVAAKQKDAEPVSKITIVPHTQGALGYTMQLPEEEKFLMTKDDLYVEIRTLLGGRAAEELVFGTQTSGAANDIERATDLARKLVTMFGMSDKFGPMGLATVQNQYLDGGYGLTCAQDTAALVDQEVRSIIEECRKGAMDILTENRADLDNVADYLLLKETITGAEMMAILRGEDPTLLENPAPTSVKPVSGTVEPQARRVHMVSEPPVAPPDPETPPASPETPPADKPADE